MSEHAIIIIRGVNKYYGAFHALVDIDLTVEPGENVAKVRQDVGMVFQNFNLFPHMTVLENCILAPMKARKIPRAEAEATARKFLMSRRVTAAVGLLWLDRLSRMMMSPARSVGSRWVLV
ncbi:hypothetical protein [Paracoccus ravus]|uniref:hypothetical protein n=1 Tax=Paracoccus ravus TaxID=2447760 RepID=UPI003CC866B6